MSAAAIATRNTSFAKCLRVRDVGYSTCQQQGLLHSMSVPLSFNVYMCVHKTLLLCRSTFLVKLRKLAKITNSARSRSNLEIIHKSSCCVYATTKFCSYSSGSGVSMDFAPYTYQRKCLFQNVLVRKQSAGQCLYTNAHVTHLGRDLSCTMHDTLYTAWWV